jgi:peptidoglycan hydrolase-like protein with peptidoglycan-binding domain
VSGSLLRPYYDTELSRGATGTAVVILQKALGITADGAFGPITEAAVTAFNTAHGLTPDGVVRRDTWEALALAHRATKAFGHTRHWMPGRAR